MHRGSDGIIYYSDEEAKELKGELMICSAAFYGKCDGKECNYKGSIIHVYNDYEDFAQCHWPGKLGISIPYIYEIDDKNLY